MKTMSDAVMAINGNMKHARHEEVRTAEGQTHAIGLTCIVHKKCLYDPNPWNIAEARRRRSWIFCAPSARSPHFLFLACSCLLMAPWVSVLLGSLSKANRHSINRLPLWLFLGTTFPQLTVSAFGAGRARKCSPIHSTTTPLSIRNWHSGSLQDPFVDSSFSGSSRFRRTRHLQTRNMFWDSRYAEDGFAYGIDANDFLKQVIENDNIISLDKQMTCLDMAAGEGRNAVYLASKCSVTAVDLSQVGLDKTQELAKSQNVQLETKQADLADYDFGREKWDLIVGFSAHLPPPIQRRVLAAIPAALKPNGVVIMEACTPAQLEYKTGGPPTAEMCYSAQIFKDAFDGPLELVRNQEIVREWQEGKYHKGKAALVQLIARKPAST